MIDQSAPPIWTPLVIFPLCVGLESTGVNPGLVLHIFSLVILTTFLFEVSIIWRVWLVLGHNRTNNTRYYPNLVTNFTFFLSLVKILLKLVAFRLKYFTHKFEVFDGMVVVISWLLDVASMCVPTCNNQLLLLGIYLSSLVQCWRGSIWSRLPHHHPSTLACGPNC